MTVKHTVLYGPRGEAISGPTSLAEYIRDVSEGEGKILKDIIEMLEQKNNLLQDAPWVEPSGRILDQHGRPWLRVVR